MLHKNSSGDIRRTILAARRLLSDHVDLLQMVHDGEANKLPLNDIDVTTTPCAAKLSKSALLAAVSIASVAASVYKM